MAGGIIPLRRATSSRYDGRLGQESAPNPSVRPSMFDLELSGWVLRAQLLLREREFGKPRGQINTT
jgi:hypothetical protein